MARKPLIGVLGDNQIPEGDPRGPLAEELGQALIDGGYRIACGGMGGVMNAVCCGARRSEHYRDGDIVGILPDKDASRVNEYVDIAIPTGLGLARNSIIALSDAVIGLGGGSGTLSEMAFAWQFNRLVIGMRTESGWSGKLADQPLDARKRFVNIDDDRVYGADSAIEAVEILKTELQRYLPTSAKISDKSYN